MKKTASKIVTSCLAATILFSAIPSSTTSAHTIIEKENNNQTIFTESFINIIDGFIEVSDKEFKITDQLALRKKISEKKFNALKEQIAFMNSQIQEVGKENLSVKGKSLVLNFNLEEIDGDIVTTLAKEGINKIDFKVWGYKVWLSRTTVERVIRVGAITGGTAGGGLASSLIGVLPGAIAGALVGSIVAEFIAPEYARAIYAEVVWPAVVMKLEYQ